MGLHGLYRDNFTFTFFDNLKFKNEKARTFGIRHAELQRMYECVTVNTKYPKGVVSINNG
jgi:hypothetical protein